MPCSNFSLKLRFCLKLYSRKADFLTCSHILMLSTWMPAWKSINKLNIYWTILVLLWRSSICKSLPLSLKSTAIKAVLWFSANVFFITVSNALGLEIWFDIDWKLIRFQIHYRIQINSHCVANNLTLLQSSRLSFLNRSVWCFKRFVWCVCV